MALDREARLRTSVAAGTFLLVDFAAQLQGATWGWTRASWHLAAFGIAALAAWIALGMQRRNILLWAALCVLVAGLRGALVALSTSPDTSPGVFAHGLVSVATLALAWGAWASFDRAGGASCETGFRLRGAATFAVVYAIALRGLYAPSVELLADETYYWQYAQHLAWSYLDHPPLVGWLIALSTGVFGDAAWAVRLPGLLAWFVMAGFLARLTRDLYDRATARVALASSATLPLCFGMGFFLTPDILSYAAWAAMLYFAERVLLCEQPKAWYGFGVALGLGLLGKYSVVFPAASALIFALLDPRARRMLRCREFGLGLAIAALSFAPVIAWNAENEWISFAFQSTRRLAVTARFSPHYLVLHAVLLLTPVGAWALFTVARSAIARRPIDLPREVRYLACFILLPLGFYLLFSLRQYPRFHWTGGAWLAAIPLLANHLVVQTRNARSRAWAHAWSVSVASLLALYAFAFHFLALGLPGAPTLRATDYLFWRETTPAVIALREELGAETGASPVVVGMAKWSIASALEYHDRADRLGPVSARHLFGCAASMYESWRDPREAVGRPLLLVGHVPEHLERDYIDDRLEGASPVKRLEIRREGQPIRQLLYRKATRYLGPEGRRNLFPPPFDCGTGGPEKT